MNRRNIEERGDAKMNEIDQPELLSKLPMSLTYTAQTAEDMREIGQAVASVLHGHDVIVLSGPLGAGKTTFSQGIGQGLKILEPVVSPTFTIARELNGEFSNGELAHLVHVDAYRLPGSDNDDEMNYPEVAAGRLLDELESLGLDEELEDPSNDTVILIEWGSMMASVLADDRLDIMIERPTYAVFDASGNLTSDGERHITLNVSSEQWARRLRIIADTISESDSVHVVDEEYLADMSESVFDSENDEEQR